MREEIAAARRSQITLLSVLEPEIAAGTSVAKMTSMATRDRMDLGIGFLRLGQSLLRDGTRRQDAFALRSSIGRLYYAMYQSACALAYDDFGGHDKNGHQDVPKYLPKQFPHRAQRSNDLKEARLRRNEADYGPYPTEPIHWMTIANAVEAAASTFVAAADTYLRGKGI